MNDEIPDLKLLGAWLVLYLLGAAALVGAGTAIGLAIGIGWRLGHWAAGVGG